MLGISDLKDVVGLGLSLGNAFGDVLEDGKFNVLELVAFVPALTKLPAAVEGFENVLPQLRDLDEAELAELSAFVQETFDIPQDRTEAAIEDAVKLVGDIYLFVQKHFLGGQAA